MSTPETNASTEYDDDRADQAAFDWGESFHAVKDLLFVSVLLWVLRMATHDLSGGWTTWSYIALGALAMVAVEAVTRLVMPAVRLFGAAAALTGRRARSLARRLGKEAQK